MVYGETTKYLYHLEHDHGLPTMFTPNKNDDIERMTCYQQVKKTFWGSLETYKIKLIDLNFFVKKKKQIQPLFREKCRNEPRNSK